MVDGLQEVSRQHIEHSFSEHGNAGLQALQDKTQVQHQLRHLYFENKTTPGFLSGETTLLKLIMCLLGHAQ